MGFAALSPTYAVRGSIAIPGLLAPARIEGRWVVDGRDIGTVVFPDACCKIFLTASAEARARRRHREQQAKGIGALMTLEEVTADILRRDRADTTRAASPLRKAEGAAELDSSDMSLEQVVEWIVRHHQAHG